MTYLDAVVCIRIMWAEGTYVSCRMKSPREDQMLEYDVLILDNVFVHFNFYYGYVE